VGNFSVGVSRIIMGNNFTGEPLLREFGLHYLVTMAGSERRAVAVRTEQLARAFGCGVVNSGEMLWDLPRGVGLERNGIVVLGVTFMRKEEVGSNGGLQWEVAWISGGQEGAWKGNWATEGETKAHTAKATWVSALEGPSVGANTTRYYEKPPRWGVEAVERTPEDHAVRTWS
jgi:hypothetical protein